MLPFSPLLRLLSLDDDDDRTLRLEEGDASSTEFSENV
jgi:hypothetical protein